MLKLTSPETSLSVGFPAPRKCFSLCGRAFLLLSLFCSCCNFRAAGVFCRTQNAEHRMQNAERRMMVSGIECETCAFWREGGSDELLFTRLLHHADMAEGVVVIRQVLTLHGIYFLVF